MPDKKPTFRIEPFSVDIPVDNEKTVLELGLKKGLPIENSCGGSGSCGTCRVFIRAGAENLEPRNEVELSMAEDRGFLENERLSCQISPVEALVVEVPYSDSEEFK